MNLTRLALQVVLVAALIVVFTLATDFVNFRSPWNLLWMAGIPFGIAKAFDRDDGIWLLTGLWLLLCALGAMVATAALFGLIP